MPWRNTLLHTQKALRPDGVVLIIGPTGMRVYGEDMKVLDTKDEGNPVSVQVPPFS